MGSEVVVIGILVSMLFYEFTEISPAGLIVPAYMALYLTQPSKIIYTLAISLVTFIICKQLDKVMILYGRRKFSVMIIVAFLLSLIVNQLGIIQYGMSTIGSIIPGVVANEFDKQGISKSLLGLIITMAIIMLILMLFGEGLLTW